jgi:hypothetical protein
MSFISFCLSFLVLVLVLVLLKYGRGTSCQNSSYGKEPEPEKTLAVKLLPLAMARGCYIMKA